MSRSSGSLRARLSRLERGRPERIEVTPEAAEAFDWFAPGCPCGLPPGECRVHHRARPSQHPPAGDWKTVLWLCGRGYGKTRVGAELVRLWAEEGAYRRIALVGPTEDDVRNVMIEGESGILAISPPWFRPRYDSTIGRLTWPNGVTGWVFSAAAPERLRGPQHHAAWCDEVGAWHHGERAWDMLMFGLRLGSKPTVAITTTPRPSKLVKALVADGRTKVVRGSTHENKSQLAPPFFEEIIAKYEGTRLGDQEIYAELLEVSEGAWFSRFDTQKTMTPAAEYNPLLPVYIAIDAGTSRTTAAVWFQVQQLSQHHHRVNVFGEYLHVDRFSEENARAILELGQQLPCLGRYEFAYIDPASSQRTSIGPSAFGEYQRVFGSGRIAHSPPHRVVDGLDQIELLLERGHLVIHPRCPHLKAAFQNYRRAERGGEWINQPAIDQSPYEDSMDALRYGIRSRFPEGRPQQTTMRHISARGMM